MNKKKTFIIIGIVITVIIVLIAVVFLFLNKAKKSISVTDFKNKMEAKNYIVEDLSSEFNGYENINSVYIAVSSDNDKQFEFATMNSESDAESLFNENKDLLQSEKTDSAIETSENGKNYDKYDLITDDNYIVVSRIDNTMIYVDTSSENKEIIQLILKELGY